MGKKFKVTVNGEVFDVEIEEVGASSVSSTNKITREKSVQSATASTSNEITTSKETVRKNDSAGVSGKKVIAAPLPGKILSVNVKKGDRVKKGDLLLVVEAMKMENEIFASEGGVVSEVLVSPGDYVSTGDKLIVME